MHKKWQVLEKKDNVEPYVEELAGTKGHFTSHREKMVWWEMLGVFKEASMAGAEGAGGKAAEDKER